MRMLSPVKVRSRLVTAIPHFVSRHDVVPQEPVQPELSLSARQRKAKRLKDDEFKIIKEEFTKQKEMFQEGNGQGGSTAESNSVEQELDAMFPHVRSTISRMKRQARSKPRVHAYVDMPILPSPIQQKRGMQLRIFNSGVLTMGPNMPGSRNAAVSNPDPAGVPNAQHLSASHLKHMPAHAFGFPLSERVANEAGACGSASVRF